MVIVVINSESNDVFIVKNYHVLHIWLSTPNRIVVVVKRVYFLSKILVSQPESYSVYFILIVSFNTEVEPFN
jgi:hypothetical protein